MTRKMGCCWDKSCTPKTCMNLPDGLTCGDCAYVRKCCAMYGHKPDDTYCDWFPRRFQPAADRAEDEVNDVS